MQFEYAYLGSTAMQHRSDWTELSFAPDLRRSPTFFSGELRQQVAFREALSALHDVVVSDLRLKPRDRTGPQARAAQRQLSLPLGDSAARHRTVIDQLKALREELAELERESSRRKGDLHAARARYFRYLYEKRRDLYLVYDPVLTVHPDELSLECFSQDESSYGRLSASYDAFQHLGERSCGTTNVDYSTLLYEELQKIRAYKRTRFEVDASGFTPRKGRDAACKKVSIELPDSWVRGFLQVSSAMGLSAVRFTLHRLDMHHVLSVLRRPQEAGELRALRYKLTPGQPVRVVFEPWGLEVECPRSVYEGEGTHDVRVWGGRRLGVLERLVTVARRFTVHLLGSGLPSYHVADLGDLSFTLGLSGWTAQDGSAGGPLELMAPRGQVDALTRRRVQDALKEAWLAKPEALASRLGLERGVVLDALSACAQSGQALWDLNKGVYRARELSRQPLPLEQLRFANEREERALRLLEAGAVSVTARPSSVDGSLALSGSVREGGKVLRLALRLDGDLRLVLGECACEFFQRHRLHRGPCEHLLAMRLRHSRLDRI